MPHHFARIAFTPTVKKVQEDLGSRSSYARMEGAPDAVNHRLTEAEAGFIAARNSLYLATVSETGWPCIQHRGGPAGFVRVLDERTIGFADFRGNRQYVSVGNLMTDDRNCPQHITRRYTLEELHEVTAPLTARIAELEAELARRPAPPAATDQSSGGI